MSLRIRLALAFFALSVLPLGAVTLYAYTNNVRALRDAAEREADLLAGELGQRMQLVTTQLSERVEHLMDIAELQEAVESASARNAQTAAAEAPAPAPVDATVHFVNQAALGDSIAHSLGEAAMLLNNVELQNFRSSRSGGSGRPPQTSEGRGSGRASGAPVSSRVVKVEPMPSPVATQSAAPRVGGRGDRDTTAHPPGTPHPQVAPPAAPPPPPAPKPTTWIDSTTGKLMIDMGPIRRDMYRQIVPGGRIENLKPEERDRVAKEVNQRMLGIAQGIKIGAAELAKRAEEANKEQAAKADADAKAAMKATAKPPPTPAKAPDFQRRSSLTGSRIDVKIERDGEVVRQMNAEINLPNVLATVFSTTRSDRGEVPFAVAKDGTIYARSEDHRVQVAAFGDVAKPDGPATARQQNWIVVTTQDTSGSGLRLGIARPVSDSLATLRRTAARNAGLGLLFIGVALVGIVPLSSRLTRNLTTLNDAVGRLAKGDYRARVTVKGRDEVANLATAFNKMAGDVERHQQTAVERERIRHELELGRQIQNEMLPHAPLHLGLTQVQGVSVPAREVGGDFFNYFMLDSGHVALLMGDVSGKGVGAALLMANIQASLRVRLGLGQDLSAVADAIDRDIDANSPGPVYATMFVGIFDPSNRQLRYVNAGHNPQYVLRLGGGLERMPATGLPVGMLSGRGYSEQRIQLSAGDQLFFYTDGCVETENDRQDMFGLERLEPLLVAAAKAEDPLKHIEQGIAGFRGTSEQADDATLMTVRVG